MESGREPFGRGDFPTDLGGSFGERDEHDLYEARKYAKQYASLGFFRRTCIHSPKEQRQECIIGLGTISAMTTSMACAMRWGIAPTLNLRSAAPTSSSSTSSTSTTATSSSSSSSSSSTTSTTTFSSANSQALQALELAFWGCAATMGICILGLIWVPPKTLRPKFSDKDSDEPDKPFGDVKKRELCSVCGVERPPPPVVVHHCSICKVCVVDYDHHCGILGRCIAKRNMPLFYGLLASGSIGTGTFTPLMILGAHKGVGSAGAIALALTVGAPLCAVSSVLALFFGCSVMQDACGDEASGDPLSAMCTKIFGESMLKGDLDSTRNRNAPTGRCKAVCRVAFEQGIEGTILFYDALFDITLMPICTVGEFVYSLVGRGSRDPKEAARLITNGPRLAALHGRMTLEKHYRQMGAFSRGLLISLKDACCEDLNSPHMIRRRPPSGFDMLAGDTDGRDAYFKRMEHDMMVERAEIERRLAAEGLPTVSTSSSSSPSSSKRGEEMKKSAESSSSSPLVDGFTWLMCALPSRARKAAYDCVMSPWTRKRLRKERKEAKEREKQRQSK